MESTLLEALSEALGCGVDSISSRVLGGGCINDARVLTVDGDRFFFKTNARALPGHFEAEAAGRPVSRRTTRTSAITHAFGDVPERDNEFRSLGSPAARAAETTTVPTARTTPRAKYFCTPHMPFSLDVSGQPSVWVVPCHAPRVGC